jgi:transcriptional regulator with XRE-family HTH domain
MAPRSPAHEALGKAIVALRKRQTNLSQERFAIDHGIDRSYLGGLERGERNPTYEILLRVAEALDVSLSQLIAEAERQR